MKSLAQIAAELPAHDPHALPAELVHAFVDQLVQQPVAGVEHLPLPHALGRVLAQDVASPFDVPPHDNAAMDGYALRGAELRPGQPLRLRVAGSALAGAPWPGPVAPGECIKIMTGALLPAGLDTVAPQELVQAHGDTIVLPANAVRPGDHRRPRGEELRAGQPALQQGQRLGPAALGLLASLGLPQVTVTRRLRVACLSTGDELLAPGQPPRPGAVYDSNRYALGALLAALGVQVIDLGAVPDQPAALRAAFSAAAAQADAVVTSGGVGVGEADHTKALMRELGDIAFWRVAMRPGRPLAVGRLRPAAAPKIQEKTGSSARPASASSSEIDSNPTPGALLFALPGNPVAAMVTFIVFVRPALLRLMGARAQPPVLLRATAETPLRKLPGRTEYQRGIVTPHPDGRLTVRTTGPQGSALLSSMVQANGLIVLPHHQGSVAAGEEVQVMMFEGVV